MRIMTKALLSLSVAAIMSSVTSLACSATSTDSDALARFKTAERIGQAHLKTFDTLDFDVYTNQKWDRLKESHSPDILVHYPDGHTTKGLAAHIEALKPQFVFAPDTSIRQHPVKIESGEWTAVIGVMEGTFTKPMSTPSGPVAPTGKPFKLTMTTVGHWKNGVMDEEYLFWDNARFMDQIGLSSRPATPPTNAAFLRSEPTMPSEKQQVVDLLMSIQTGAPGPIASINPEKYVQHNLGAGDGLAGFGTLMQAIPKGSARVNTVRVFQDGDYVFTHTDYNFFGPKIGFDIFRFENGKIVEHWDNLQNTAGPNPSGHTMIDGPTKAIDLDKTDANKALVRAFVEDILIHHRSEKLAGYFAGNAYVQHNPQIADGLTGLSAGFAARAKAGILSGYNQVHLVLGEGDFVLIASDGQYAGKPAAYYDLFRVQDGKIAEHWDTRETIPPRMEWKNSNGKFLRKSEAYSTS